MIPRISTEFVSDEYLHVNACGCQHLFGQDMGSLRAAGRADFHVLYIAEGCCFVTMDGKELEVPAGGVILYLPHEYQNYRFRADVPSVSYFIHFTGTGCAALLEKLGMMHARIFAIGKSEALENAFNRLIDEFHLARPLSSVFCAAYLAQVLAVIGRKLRYANRNERLVHNNQIDEVCRRMHRDYAGEHHLAYYAALCNLSESRFSHLFKACTGSSPKQYLLHVRLTKAQELLENTDLPILLVGEAVGFADQNYFSRIFKKSVGKSPMEYRASF